MKSNRSLTHTLNLNSLHHENPQGGFKSQGSPFAASFDLKDKPEGTRVQDPGHVKDQISHMPQFSVNDQISKDLYSHSLLEKTPNRIDLDLVSEYFDKIIQKITETENKFMKKIEEVEIKIEVIEFKQDKSHKTVENCCKQLEELQKKLYKPLYAQRIAETSFNNLQTLQLSNKKETDSDSIPRLKDPALEDSLQNKIKENPIKIEKYFIKKLAGLEDRLIKVEKASDQVSNLHKTCTKTLQKVKKIEERANTGHNTPTDFYNNTTAQSPLVSTGKKSQSRFNIGDECESIIVGALLDRVNNSLKSTPDRPQSSAAKYQYFDRVPSTDLKESLRQKGYFINEDKNLTKSSFYRKKSNQS
jgi:hypothetical protein